MARLRTHNRRALRTHKRRVRLTKMLNDRSWDAPMGAVELLSNQARIVGSMMRGSRYYVLEGREPKLVDMMTWATYLEKANRHVAETEVTPGVRVSTVFLGLDHNFFGEGPPILFETMTFSDYGETGTGFGRYATWAEAELGHMEAVEELQASLGVELAQS